MSVKLHVLARLLDRLGLPAWAARVRAANERRAKGRDR